MEDVQFYDAGEEELAVSPSAESSPPLAAAQEEDDEPIVVPAREYHVITIGPNDDERTKHWKTSPYAVGLVDITWKSHHWNPVHNGHPSLRERDSNFALICSSLFCRCCGAGSRLGNMVLLPGTNIILGPYWPMLFFITIPLILGVSILTAYTKIPQQHPALIGIWTILTLSLLLSLIRVSCRNPGILKRHLQPPAEEDWIWNDQALTYRPRSAKYDPECALVFIDFDHTCPWTGTAIAKNNMKSFKWFVALVGTMLIFDIVLLAF
jgi:hypothetical protein